jgi:hypothetical protein
VIPYLTNGQVATLADDLRQLAHSIQVSWIVEYLPKRVYLYRSDRSRKQMKNAPFRFRPEDWIAFFAQHGWRQKTIRYLGIEGMKLGRRAPLPWKTRVLIRIVRPFRRKKNRAQLERLLGYAVLEPIPG